MPEEIKKGDYAMDHKIREVISEKTVNVGNLPQEAEAGKVKEQTRREYAGAKISLKRNYNAISKNGDTLEISEAGRTLGVQTEREDSLISDRNRIAGSGKKIPDAALAGYSKARLKQLYTSKKITKQQYERMLKKIK